MMKVTARNAAGTVLNSTNIVLPVSDEMDCTACHSPSSGPAARPFGGWIHDTDPQREYRLNILKLHDDMQASNAAYGPALTKAGYLTTGLYDTASTADATKRKAILCAACHLSEALKGSGQAGIPPLTQSIHSMHSHVIDPTNGMTLDSVSNRSACYRCHPGSETKCLRGAMGNAVAADGSMLMQCQSCHGLMSAVGASTRTGWLNEPTCQQCHTGTATQNNGQIRYTSVFDSHGAPRVAVSNVFATSPNAPATGLSLYRFSSGHGGLQCSACHGSTHAEFPSSHANDNIQNITLQGHAGVLSECSTCHNGSVPTTTNGGPHGLHPVGTTWVGRHESAAKSGLAACQACHGTDYKGTVLSRMFATRTFNTEKGTFTFAAGTMIGCSSCHTGPSGEGNPPAATPTPAATRTPGPTATPVSTSTPTPSPTSTPTPSPTSTPTPVSTSTPTPTPTATPTRPPNRTPTATPAPRRTPKEDGEFTPRPR